jgi:hypothetical protein
MNSAIGLGIAGCDPSSDQAKKVDTYQVLAGLRKSSNLSYSTARKLGKTPVVRYKISSGSARTER